MSSSHSEFVDSTVLKSFSGLVTDAWWQFLAAVFGSQAAKAVLIANREESMDQS
jgi:hypothetical protein